MIDSIKNASNFFSLRQRLLICFTSVYSSNSMYAYHCHCNIMSLENECRLRLMVIMNVNAEVTCNYECEYGG